MSKDLRMEVFASTDVVQPVSFHKYVLHSQRLDNPIVTIRNAVRTLSNYSNIGIFEDGKNIYTTEKLQEPASKTDFTLEYVEFVQLPVCQYRTIYSKFIQYAITRKLATVLIEDKYRKYSCKSSVTSKWILTDKGFQTFKSKNKEITLERKYKFRVEILDDGKAYLHINTSSAFISNLSVYDYMQRGFCVVGMEVKNDWSQNTQVGKVVEVCDFTVVDKVPGTFLDSVKNYYIGKNQGYRVEHLPDNTKVVMVELQPNQQYPYYPQALKPVLTREKVMELDKEFSLAVDRYMKRDMPTRFRLDKDFVKDIGVLSSVHNLQFHQDTCTVDSMGYKKATIPLPELVCGNNKTIACTDKYRVFSHGFYRQPDRPIQIGYIYPEGPEGKLGAVANAICSFANSGKYQDKEDRYTTKRLLRIKGTAMVKEEYALGDITDYKRAAQNLQKKQGIDLIIALVPDGQEEENPYNPFKSVWAKCNIPSQMISLSTAELFAAGAAEGNKSKYYLHNIILGILGKTGGIPWVIKDMPGNVDCFVGLDVATIDRGIHLPACSVMFDKQGRFLGFYKPTAPQKGEKITSQILQEIFDNVILSYEEKFGSIPKHILIHRDGFSNENQNWYDNYFQSKGIAYSIVEVRKNIDAKLMFLQDNKIQNPTMGHCIYNREKAYLVTTDIASNRGSPNPILIEKKCGNISMKDILYQVMYLSQLHIGSTHKTRLPITTEYADKMCKNREFIPDGIVSNRLFFL